MIYGDRVEVTQGSFMGHRGTVVKHESNGKVFVRLDHGASVTIPASYLKTIGNQKSNGKTHLP